MSGRRQQQQRVRAGTSSRALLAKKARHSDSQQQHQQSAAGGARGNNALADEREVREHRFAQQDAAIALAQRATDILNAQSDPDTLDLRPFAAELDDVLVDELARQLHASLKRASRLSHEQPSNEQQQCHRYQQLYSTVVLSGCDRFTPVGARSFIHAVGASIQRLDASRTALSLDVLTVLATGIAQLEALDLSWCLELTSERVRAFIPCCNRALTRLNVSNCPALNDDALGWISGTLGPQGALTQCRRLRSIDVAYTLRLSDRGLVALGRGCCALQFVNLEGLDRISSAGVLALVAGCSRLRVLSLRKCRQLTDSALVHIGTHARQLQSLNVCGCVRLTSTGLCAMVRGTPALQALTLEGCTAMREDVLAAVATHCVALQVLNVSGCEDITDNGLATLSAHLPFVQPAQTYRGLEPRAATLRLKFAVQQHTIDSSAALRIQALFRGNVARRLAATWRIERIETPARRTIRRSYVSWRLRFEIDRRIARRTLERVSAVKIQALVRGVQGRTALARANDEAQRLRVWSALAVRIQAAYRSHWTRRRYAVVVKTIERYRRERALVVRHRAAMRLQRAYRKRLDRSRLVDVMRLHKQRRMEQQCAAVTLQRLFRSRAARSAYRQLQAALAQQQLLDIARKRFAVQIQSQWRGRRARQQRAGYERERHDREYRRASAASRISAGARGYFARRVTQQLRFEWQTQQLAAKRIQRAFRRFLTPSAKRVAFDRMLAVVQHHAFDERGAALAKQQALLHRTRALIDRDSASEDEGDDDDSDWRDFVDANGEQFWFSAAQRRRVYVRPLECARERAMLGLACRVFWPLEQQWFSGTVARFHRSKNKHRVAYDDGDHEWLCFRREHARVQLFNGYCWCLAATFEPTLRTLRATAFVGLRVQCYDARSFVWRSGVVKAYNEPSDHFLVGYDDHVDTGGSSGISTTTSAAATSLDEWVDLFRNENWYQVQDAITREWYSLSGYVFGRVRGRPLNFLTMANGRPGVAEHYYSVEDYLTYVEEERVEMADDNNAIVVAGVNVDVDESSVAERELLKAAEHEREGVKVDMDPTRSGIDAGVGDDADDEEDGDEDEDDDNDDSDGSRSGTENDTGAEDDDEEEEEGDNDDVADE